jgi:hypothetical protein
MIKNDRSCVIDGTLQNADVCFGSAYDYMIMLLDGSDMSVWYMLFSMLSFISILNIQNMRPLLQRGKSA